MNKLVFAAYLLMYKKHLTQHMTLFYSVFKGVLYSSTISNMLKVTEIINSKAYLLI